jgi:hypothetical protein
VFSSESRCVFPFIVVPFSALYFRRSLGINLTLGDESPMNPWRTVWLKSCQRTSGRSGRLSNDLKNRLTMFYVSRRVPLPVANTRPLSVRSNWKQLS